MGPRQRVHTPLCARRTYSVTPSVLTLTRVRVHKAPSHQQTLPNLDPLSSTDLTTDSWRTAPSALAKPWPACPSAPARP